jgi:hypothetical protein
MPNPQEAFGAYYGAMSDEEILRVAANEASLVPSAQAALRAELRKRGKEALAGPPAVEVEGPGIFRKRWTPTKLLFAPLLGFWLVVPNVIVLVFRRGESQAYYAGAASAIVLGLGLIIWYWKKTK